MADEPTRTTGLNELPLALTVQEAARQLRISPTTAYEQASRWLATEGAEGLPVVRLGRVPHVPRVAVERLLLVTGEADVAKSGSPHDGRGAA